MNNNDCWVIVFFACILVGFLAYLFGCYAGGKSSDEYWKKECVRRGVAEYNSESEWVWK